MEWFAQAPSNIALIKYMGKLDAQKNIPLNPSLSYTLSNLLSSVKLEVYPGKKDRWEPLDIPGGKPFTLSEAAQQRFLNHLSRLKQLFNYNGSFIVRSCNNFPHSSGLASSASSFAALTKCAFLALCELTHSEIPSIETQAMYSRMASGSSCRSFFEPWALWDGEHVSTINFPFKQLIHQAIITSHAVKSVSSSDAHQRITSSPLYATRANSARDNLKTLVNALETQDWRSAYEVCWREFQDMHQLFKTSNPPFTYMDDNTSVILRAIQALWEKEQDGPLVTMDAGPNIHLLYRPDQMEMAMRFKADHLIGNYDVL